MTGRRLFFVAGEPSGDELASEVIRAARDRIPDIEIGGVGGPAMAAAGASSEIDISPLAVLGFVEGLLAYRRVVRLADVAAAAAIAFAPDSVILVDSWGFTLRVAQRIRRRAPQIRLVKLVGPQVWATRPGRARTLARAVDRLLCIHRFEVPYYEPLGLPAKVIGNPALSRAPKGNGPAFRAHLGIGSDEPVLLILPGSRPSEIARVAPPMIAAASRLQHEAPGLRVVAAPAEAVRGRFEDALPPAAAITMLDPSQSRFDAMAGCTAALACSGTVTTELAVQGAPFVVGYKVGWLTWLAARYVLFKADYITLLNVAAGEEVAPERIQGRLTAEDLAAAVRPLLTEPAACRRQIQRQFDALRTMGLGDPPAAAIAAEDILSSG